MAEPTRGEVWWIDFEPAVGSEANKIRPAIVVSSQDFDAIRTRLVVPLTTWQPRHAIRPNRVRVFADPENGLDVDSSADVLHMRSLSLQRFRARVGVVGEDALARLAAAIRIVLELDEA